MIWRGGGGFWDPKVCAREMTQIKKFWGIAFGFLRGMPQGLGWVGLGLGLRQRR